MSFVKRFYFVLAALLLVSVAASAQTTNANLTGSVSLGGSPLPGATVTISSPALQGVRTTNSDVNGNYNFVGLPPGQYTVRFDMESMQSVTRTVPLTLGGTARADADLKLTAVAENITVTATSPAVLETTEVQSNMQQTVINKLPTNRTPTGVALLMPGTAATGPRAAIVISGATADQNLITVDGANIQENLRGQQHALFIEDAIQETTVLTGNISAEYGRFEGGVVNSITKSGGNDFHGSYRDTLTNASWTRTTPFPGDIRAASQLNHSHEATFGGRILRDKLWFFASGRQAKTNGPQAFASAGGPTQQFTNDNVDKRLEGKLTAQITAKHNLVGTYLKSPFTQTNNCQLGCFEQQALDPSITQANDFITGHYNGVLTNNWLVEALYSRKTFTFIGFGGDNRDPVAGSPLLVITPAGALAGDANAPYFCGVCDQETRNNHELEFKSSYFFASKALGTHNIVGGYDKWAETRLSNNFQSPTNNVLNTYTSGFERDPVTGTAFFSLVPDVDYLANYPILTPSLGSNLASNSLFINDKWALNNHLNFNLGARYDANESENSLHAKISNDHKISPRLGVNYDVLGNGRIRLNAGYSVYVGRLAEGVTSASSPAGSPASFYYAYEGPELHHLTSAQYSAAFYSWLNSVGGIANLSPFFVSIPGAGSVIRGSLASPNAREFSFGGGAQIGTNGYVRADYIDRRFQDFYVNQRDLSTGQVTINGRPTDLTVITNSNVPQKTYKAVQMQAQYRLFDRLQLGGNYTYSKLRGNTVGENAGSGPIAEGFSTTFYPEFQNFARNAPIGFLPADQTHKVRAWASYDLHTFIGNLNLGAIERYDSGSPYSAAATILTAPEGIGNPGYATPPTTTTYFFSDRGAFRTDALRATDLSATFSFPAVRGFELYATGYLFNAFNNHAIVNVTSGANTVIQTGVRTSRTAGSGLVAVNPLTNNNPIECPQGQSAAQCAALGANFQLVSNFGAPLSKAAFQNPRSYQAAVGLRF
jgi:hypothetical protein